MKIEFLIYRDNCLLMVFYTRSKCYQYSLTLKDGSIYTPQEIYYTPTKAYNMGLEKIKSTIDRQ